MQTIRDCNVAVVGGAGFLGSHLVDHLIEDRGCRVLVVDNLCAGRSEFIHKDAAFELFDITGSENELCEMLSDFRMSGSKSDGVDYVFNYAAWPYVPDSYKRPLQVCNVNFFGALKVINAAQEAGVKGILQVSSAEVYGEGQAYSEHGHLEKKMDESAPVVPHSSYGASKAAIDALVQVRWKESRTPCIALRQFNCIGERETHSYIVPEIISQLCNVGDLGGKRKPDTHFPTVYLGNNSFRDFLYAGDAVRIAVELLERGEFGEVYNLGSETGIKMYDLAKRIGKVMGFADVIVEEDEARKRPWEIWYLQSDNGKLYEALGRNDTLSNSFEIRTSLDEALKKTVKWFGENGRKWPWEK